MTQVKITRLDNQTSVTEDVDNEAEAAALILWFATAHTGLVKCEVLSPERDGRMLPCGFCAATSQESHSEECWGTRN